MGKLNREDVEGSEFVGAGMRYEAQHKGKGRWQVWDNIEGIKVNDGWLDRSAAETMASNFSTEGADAKPKLSLAERPERPNAPDLGKAIVDFVLSQYDHWDPCDWHMVCTAMEYARRHGKYWGDSTR